MGRLQGKVALVIGASRHDSMGLTVTPMLEGFMAPGMEQAFVKEMPRGRLKTVEDVANTALYVASDECFIAGQTFHVTGGLTLRRNPTAPEIAAANVACSAGHDWIDAPILMD